MRLYVTRTFDDIVSQYFNNHDKSNETNWWYISCKMDCLSCKTENLVDEAIQSFLCLEFGEEQQLTQPYFTHKNVATFYNQFLVQIQDHQTDCVKCKSEMVRLPFANKFPPKLTKDKYFLTAFSVANIFCGVPPCRLNK